MSTRRRSVAIGVASILGLGLRQGLTLGLGLGLALGSTVGCGGKTPAPAAATSDPAVEEFGPGLAAHGHPAAELTEVARRTLAASYTVAPDSEPGTLRTEWAVHDAARWPGAETRVVVVLADERVIVRVQCRMAGSSCARTVPEDVKLVDLAQDLAYGIAGDGLVGEVLLHMRNARNEVCACKDQACVELAEERLMSWAMKHMDELKDLKPTQAQDEEADRIQDEMDACKDRVASPKRDPSTSGT